MKIFSHLNLLQEAINGNHKGVIRTLFEPKYIRVDLSFPRYYYLRGKVLVDDVNELIDEQIPTFTFEKLVQLLYEDVLHLAKERPSVDLAKAFKRFIQKKEEREAVVVEDLKPVNAYQLELKTLRTKNRLEQVVIHPVPFHRKLLLRGEILIHDMMKAMPGLTITLPEVIVLRFIDCMEEVERNNPVILKNIMAAFQEE